MANGCWSKLFFPSVHFRGRSYWLQLHPKNDFQFSCQSSIFGDDSDEFVNLRVVLDSSYAHFRRRMSSAYVHFRGQTNFHNLVFCLALPASAEETRNDKIYRQFTPGAFSRLDLNDIMPLKLRYVTSWTLFCLYKVNGA